MPEHPQLAIIKLSCSIRFHCLIYAKILVITCKYLSCVTTRMVIQNKIFKQIKKVFLLADTTKHCFKSYTTFILLRKTLPFMEKFKLTSESTHLCFHTVGKHKKSIVIKQVRNRIQIICIIVIIGILHIYRILFQLNKK